MRRFAVLFFAIGVCLSGSFGCGGCDDTGSTTNNNDNNQSTNNMTTLPDGCTDGDGDGFPTGLTCDGQVDCADDDPDIHPGVEEVCFDQIDNDCDGAADEGCPECNDGATESCGSDVGRCVAGTRTCTDGQWSDCEGSEGPFTEECNGEDDNCDGQVDENANLLCDDGVACNGVELCQAGACTTGEEIDCGHLDGPCVEGLCSEKDRGCRAFPKENGTTCDDGLFCTTDGVCSEGECQVQPRDCATASDACNVGVCDEGADECVPQPVSDGTTCDDGEFCTVMDTCAAGVCGGAARDCSSAADQCNEGVCDETADSCVPSPIANDTACDDGMYCTVSDSCQNGTCTGGGARECGAAGGSCRDGVCDEATDSCTGDPVANGTACEDGQFCTTGDTCFAGNCMGGGARDCSSEDALCKVGTCSEQLNRCIPANAADNTTCDDNAFCTRNDSCQSGVCTGTMRDCSGAGDVCNDGICDETTDSCVPRALSDGTSCTDALYCTVMETCIAGVCEKTPRSCDSQADDCNVGFCDETVNGCVPQPKADGTTCSDGQFCTENDSCQGGTCTGGPVSCSQDGNPCTVHMCDESANSCSAVAVADNTACDDGQWCTTNDLCQSGVCSGAPRNCVFAGDQCNAGFCNDTIDACDSSPRPDGTSCNDGDFCSAVDECQSGTCVQAQARDCSGAGDICNDGICDENANSCIPQPKADGTNCSTMQFCTVNEECQSGICVGDQRNCDAITNGDTCFDGVCDDIDDECVAVDNGSCDPCETGTPVAAAGNDQIVTPNTTVQLDGTGSSDPNSQPLSYTWRIDSQPNGSTAQLSSTTSPTPTILGDVSGDFVICLSVSDADACMSAEDCMTITVEPIVDLHIELVWFSDNSDVDLHYQAPPYAQTDWFRALRNNGQTASCSRTGPQAQKGPDTFWCLRNPDWGNATTLWEADGDLTNDPRLDVDNVTGYGPENINQSNVFDGDPFTIGVHYYADFVSSTDPSAGAVSARVRVYNGNNLLFERSSTLNCREFWEVAEVSISGNGTTINVSQKNSTFDADNGICRCVNNNDCRQDETCTLTSLGNLCL